ncbi:MAG: dihydroorotate dehydrogenase [Marinilabiliales bacterium]|nr:MAG: dihydroorotate dehydrogenase [Marinilabiliales bacterium]
MADLKVNYMGLELKNPVVVGANNMVYDLDKLKKMEEAGASAIVFKSLFEEQIMLEKLQMDDQLSEYDERNAEMVKLFPKIEHAGPEEYLMKLRMAVNALQIPVIASLNCINRETWVDYAKRIEEMGVAGIEMNMYNIPADTLNAPENIIKSQIDNVKAVCEAVKIPVSVKLSPFSSNALYLIHEFENAGAKGVVMFNRLFQPDIDIENQKMTFSDYTSHPEDNRIPLRYAGLLYGKVKASIIANSGIHHGEDVIKMILAGADAVQVVSTLYKNKIEHIGTMLADIEKWMNDKGYNNVHDFQGKLSQKYVDDPFAYKRAQYVDILMKSEDIFKKHPMH